MTSGESLEPDEEVIGLHYDVRAFIGDIAQKRIVSLEDHDILPGQDGYVGIRLYTDVSTPEDKKRWLWVPTNQPAVQPEMHGESSFLDDRLVIHHDHRLVAVDGTKVEFTDMEFSLFGHLVVNKGVIQTHRQIFESVWNDSTGMNSSTLKVHIMRIKKKLGGLSWTIQTVKKWGYMFNDSLPLSPNIVDTDSS